MLVLNSGIQLVALQFRLAKYELVPSAVAMLERQNPGRPKYPSNGPVPGTQVLEPTKNCSIEYFAREVELCGYEMVDALSEKRGDHAKAYYIARYVFVRHEHVERQLFSSKFLIMQQALREGLESLGKDAMWSVFGHLNRYYRDGAEVPGQEALSLNFKDRIPYTDPNGEPVLVWPKDEHGKRRIENGKIPLAAEHELQIDDSKVVATLPRHTPSLLSIT